MQWLLEKKQALSELMVVSTPLPVLKLPKPGLVSWKNVRTLVVHSLAPGCECSGIPKGCAPRDTGSCDAYGGTHMLAAAPPRWLRRRLAS